ncbi:MAG TPA: DUF5681 domain-containing protein [Bryobacteraceae bacterium]|nr:DUF5681 domain-containing protein [Bryobacteraceae bacterium]
MEPDKTGEIQGSRNCGRFVRGQSGNPAGRPRGARNKATAAALELLDGASEDVVKRVVEMAKDGDRVCLRLVLDRVIPTRRDRVVELDGLRRIRTAAEVIDAADLIIRRAAAGDISIEEARGYLAMLEVQRKAIETSEIAVRLEALESQLGGPQDLDPRRRVGR